MKSKPDPRSYISNYVNRLKESGALSYPAVERAFRQVPRHLFVKGSVRTQRTTSN